VKENAGVLAGAALNDGCDGPKENEGALAAPNKLGVDAGAFVIVAPKRGVDVVLEREEEVAPKTGALPAKLKAGVCEKNPKYTIRKCIK